MHIPKKYVHDRLILFLLSVNFFLFVITLVSVLLQLVGSNNTNFISEYRPNLERSEQYAPGGVIDIVSFILFSLIIFVAHTVLSIRSYVVQRHLSSAILALGTLLLVLSLIVSNALLRAA